MRINDITFPYPVCGIGDDISSVPSMNVTMSQTKNCYIIDFTMSLEDETIKSLIREGKAAFACEVDCPTTYFRTVLQSKEPLFHLEIPRKDVAGRVNFQCTVTVIQAIEEYTNPNFHEDYDGFSFSLEPGDILAFMGNSHYDADIKYDKLKSAGSFMCVVEGRNTQKTSYYLEHDKIEIILPPSLYSDYKTNFCGDRNLSDVFHSSIVFNALLFALFNYRPENHSDKLWARTLIYRLEIEQRLNKYAGVLEEKDPDSIMELAQDLLGNPYERLFTKMHELRPIDEENDD